MRFKRYGPRTAFEVTPRKIAAAARRRARERAALPLFAPLIAEEQPPLEAVMAARAELWERQEQAMRDFRAGQWRGVRARFYALAPEQRRNVRERMAAFWGPADAANWAYLIRRESEEAQTPRAPPS